MKIDNQSGKPANITSTVTQPKLNKVTDSLDINKTASTNVQISDQVADSNPPFSSDKVTAIKAAIAEGRFQVNSNAVATSLISTVQDLLRSQSYTA